MPRLRAALGGGPRLLVKRDDAIGFGFGGNKVRKLRLVAADALAAGASTLITSGGVQSNHARATAAVAAKLGLRAILVVNAAGGPPSRPSGNALLDELLGAEIRYVATRDERAPAMEAAADEERKAGRHPYVIPIGASMPLGAAAFALAVAELLEQVPAPDVIFHASSSGGTQAGLVAGCALAGVRTRVVGISADEPAAALQSTIETLVEGLAVLAGVPLRGLDVVVDDSFVGGGYGVPTPESQAAIEMAARSEALFLDPTYTAKAMAGLMAYVRGGALRDADTVLFWHTGGQVGLFA
jgi:1-aminocyclopropane-1-carboxylate deaminase/D-cysteine desulfhydrase-like pyridoxal-dependent ACC family enzyme